MTSGRLSGIAVLVAPVLAVALLALAGVRGEDSATSTALGEPTAVPISAANRACAAFGTNHAPASPLDVANLTVATDDAEADGDSSVTTTPDGKPVASLQVRQRGALVSDRITPGNQEAVSIASSGGIARLSSAFAATRPSDRLGGGLAVGECPRSAPTSWFVGAGATTDHTGTLVLSNPGRIEAVADVTMYGENGPVELVGGTDIVVDAGDSVRIPLERLAAGEDNVAMSVRTTRGTVAASVLDATGELSPYDGSEYLPVAARPSTESLIAGVPADADSRELLVANPGDRTADVSINIVGKDGSFTPTGLESISVAAGAVETVAIPGNAGKAAASVRLSSEVPVVGAVRATTSADTAYATSTEPISGPVAIPIGLDGTSVDLAATPARPETDEQLVVRAYDESGSAIGKEATVDLDAGTTVSIDPLDETSAPSGRTAYVTVEPRGVGARVAATFSDGDDWSTVPLGDLPDTVEHPAVAPGGAM